MVAALSARAPLTGAACATRTQEVAFNDKSKEEIQEALSNCLYLQDDTVVLEGAVLLYRDFAFGVLRC